MNIYEFMGDSPVLTFFLAWFIATCVVDLPKVFFRYLIDRPLRHWTIRKHGYPPAHCDVDGDFKDDTNN